MSGYNIVKAESKDSEEILDFLNEHFVPHEPINAAIKLCEAGYRSVDCWWQMMTSYQDDILRISAMLCSAPSVPQPVVQSRRRPLLGPSPG